MAITAQEISRAVFDQPVQPLFSMIYQSSLNAGIPVIVTNTNNNLRVTMKANVGSAPAGTELTDEMFNNNVSNLDVDRFMLNEDTYFTKVDLFSNHSQYPNEIRSDAAGLTPEVLANFLVFIGHKFSEKLIQDYFDDLQANIVALVPAGNVTQGMAGKIEWNPTATPDAGSQSISEIIDDILGALPLTMQPGGTAGNIVTGWVSSKDFLTLKKGTIEAYQPTPNGGMTANFFQYVKEESSISETRDLLNREFIRVGNMIILPLNGLKNDSLIVTYQQGIEKGKVFYDKVPENILNNFYMVIRGAFERNNNFTVPVKDRAYFDIPYQVGNLLTINQVENAIAQYKVITVLSTGILFRESDKVFAYLPDAAA